MLRRLCHHAELILALFKPLRCIDATLYSKDNVNAASRQNLLVFCYQNAFALILPRQLSGSIGQVIALYIKLIWLTFKFTMST